MKVPVRRCVVCRKSGDKRGLVRLVLGADGAVCLDREDRLPGRGAYLHREYECLRAAGDVGRLAHAFRVEKCRIDAAGWREVLNSLLREP